MKTENEPIMLPVSFRQSPTLDLIDIATSSLGLNKPPVLQNFSPLVSLIAAAKLMAHQPNEKTLKGLRVAVEIYESQEQSTRESLEKNL